MNPWASLGAIAVLVTAFVAGFYASSEYHANDVPAAREAWTSNALADYQRVVEAAQKRIAAADEARRKADAQRIEDGRRGAARDQLVRELHDELAAGGDCAPTESPAACYARARKLADLFRESVGLLNEGAGRVESRTREVNALYSGWPRQPIDSPPPPPPTP